MIYLLLLVYKNKKPQALAFINPTTQTLRLLKGLNGVRVKHDLISHQADAFINTVIRIVEYSKPEPPTDMAQEIIVDPSSWIPQDEVITIIFP